MTARRGAAGGRYARRFAIRATINSDRDHDETVRGGTA
jgi:hypothetical protein